MLTKKKKTCPEGNVLITLKVHLTPTLKLIVLIIHHNALGKLENMKDQNMTS